MNFLKSFTKEEKSWMMYDWANSAQSVIIVTILPIFYEAVSHNSIDAISNWGYGTSISMLIIALLSPILGRLGDFKGVRKKLFVRFIQIGVLPCFLLAVTPAMDVSTPEGSSLTSMIILVLYIICSIGFSGANIFYDSFLPDVTTEDRMDKVSTMGFGLGYFGGSTIPLVIFLVLNLVGVPMNTTLIIAFLLTGFWWGGFSIPILKNVHQVHATAEYPGFKKAISNIFAKLSITMKEIFANKKMFFFLIAYFFYIDGVNTIIHMSTIYGSTLGIDSTQMLLALLLTQLLGLPFAIIYSKLSEKFGTQTMIGVGILVYIIICIYGFFIRSAVDFWILAFLVGTSQGGIQALSRSMFGKLIDDKSRSGEFYGFYDIFGKFSAILGPTIFGLASGFARDRIMISQGIDMSMPIAQDVIDSISAQAAPWGVLSVLSIFLIGGFIFFFVMPKADKKK